MNKHVRRPTQRIHKPWRLLFRFVVALIWVLLPLAKKLNSLDLIAITSFMITLVLAVEIYGMSCTDESFFEKKQASYTKNALDSDVDSLNMTTDDKENEFTKYVCSSAG